MANTSYSEAENYFQSQSLSDQSIADSIRSTFSWQFYRFSKRLMDIVGAIIALIIFAPIMLTVAVLIKLDSPGPIFFTPTRVGKAGKLFKMIKFRSMRMYTIEGEVVHASEILKSDTLLLNEYKKNSYKLKNDPRITHVGKYIRKYSLDELPQFINILKGDMSLVGPRAYLPNELIEQQEVYPQTKQYLKTLLLAKPGLSGTWQVSGRSEINFDARIKMDAEYVVMRSILYDIKILILTIPAMISGRGAV